MKLITLVSCLVASSLTFAYIAEYPKGPEATLTPGSLCDHPSKYRYPENIAYCERDVSSGQKKEIFEDYRGFGYRLDPSKRGNFKIDHYVPLCAGGSNHDDNLWPQHVSVYTITDPIEALGCEKLAAGLITQEKLVELIRLVKNDLSKSSLVMKELLTLR